MKKRNIFLILATFLCFYSGVFASQENCETMENAFEKYECRVKNFCETDYKNNKVSFDTQNYEEAEKYKNLTVTDVFLVSNRTDKPLRKAVSIYKNNMNSIYNCAMIHSQINTMNVTKTHLLKLDTTGHVKNMIEPKILQNLQKLELKSKQLKCKAIDKDMIKKESVLKETTYETCKYHFYMDYMKNYYSDVGNVLDLDEESDKNAVFVHQNVANLRSNIQTAIQMEIDQAYQTFPLAFQAYSEYENNYAIHFMLQVILDDFIVYRQKLHQALTPFNQLAYKLSNVMKK